MQTGITLVNNTVEIMRSAVGTGRSRGVPIHIRCRQNAVRMPGRVVFGIVAAQIIAAACAASNDVGGSGNLPLPHVVQVAVRVNPASYYWLDKHPTGLDYDLLKLFEQRSGVTVEIMPSITAAEAIRHLEDGTAQIAAGMLTATDEINTRFSSSPSYYRVTQQLIYRHPDVKPDDFSAVAMQDVDLSPHPAHLATLAAARSKSRDPGNWHLHEDLDSHKLIELLNLGLIRYTIADSSELAVTQLFHPYVKTAFEVPGERSVVWLMSEEIPAALAAEIEKFFSEIKDNRELDRLINQHYPPIRQMSYGDKLTFIRRLDQRLPEYRDSFVRFSRLYNFDWKLVAALAYQESNWNPRAISPTGVKGMMMLTKETANRYGVQDRFDPDNSILAGIRHLHATMKKLPATVQQPDRTWMALAAYNIGYGHLRDAIALTRKNGGNPALWTDLAQSFKLLQNPRWYSKAAHGKPRGGNAVMFVQNIRNYQLLINWLEGLISTAIPKQSRFDVLSPRPL